ncbi:methionine--tRNA ligase [Geothrix sp. 21YS21S-4]|uniref:methionine--tRNA ligase n=1 Tax=Geothrix sp. 21YS21S-4 TaxID=3068889 RepID=UPI0027B8A560|nr:methionine--tRNA ligase [Geothrix sp. 21YS21S-4]
MSKPFYITTPIYYVNDRPHIGHTYTTVLADVIARFHRMRGEDVRFLTGTDEHGQKVEKAAAARGITPKQLADEVVANYTDLWARMGMTHFRFIRTTDEDHRAQVQRLFKRLLDKGDIYKATYKGLYSVSDEAYVTETQAKELQAQGLAHQLVELEEETYFFRLSAYQDRLLEYYAAHPEFVQPDFRFNEVKRFVEGGLQDLSISRTSISWGIPVPGDEKHVIYVWFDALLNYLTGCPANGWPPDLQLVGKDILRFHAVYWPAFLMAAGMLQPTTILAHGWWLMGEDKMSKSKGNVVRPDTLLKFGNDALRFYFMRDMQVGHDRAFGFDGFIDRLNADLANGLGNLASRTLSMIQRYRGGVVPLPSVLDDLDREMAKGLLEVFPEYLEKARANDFHGALDALWTYLRALDGYIVKAEPWKLAKDPVNDPKLDAVLAILYRALRATALLVAPVMPELAQALWESLGHATKVAEKTFHGFALDGPAVGPIGEPRPLFQRIDKEKEMSELETSATAPAEVKPALDVPAIRETVDADTFFQVDLRVGRILEAERVPKSDKLIKMKVDIGLEQRTIVGGIGKAYEPADLLEKLVVVVANLAPRKLMGIESHGMLLAASDNASKPYLVAPPSDAQPGFLVK